jgi:2-dehydro-3-deoxygluconokinase
MAHLFELLPRENARYDAAALGEVMLRIDPGDVPTARARTVRFWHGGGEANVAEGLAYAFGLRAAVITALVDDGIGRNIESGLREAGVDTSNVIWFNTAGTGPFSTDAKGTLHNGIHFTWRGRGVLPSVTEYYRAHTPASQLKPGDFDWDAFFRQGVRFFHTGGIFTCIGPRTAEFALEAVKAAGAHGSFRSFDLNYRSKVEPDRDRAFANNREIVRHVEFLQGDIFNALGYEGSRPGPDDPIDVFLAAYREALLKVASDFPNLKLIGTQLRNARTADTIDWGAVLYETGTGTMHQAVVRDRVEIADRTGGGDSFASGVAGALMAGKSPAEAVEYGAAHGIIVQEFPGDTTMATLDMIEKEIARAKKGGGVSARR